MPGVAYATHYKYMCSEPGQNLVRQAIEEHNLDRIVVASCSPRLHEPTFQQCIAQAGLNPYMVEMANIREHCSWVHERPRDGHREGDRPHPDGGREGPPNEPLSQTEIPITKKALVIGGGVAGIQAALDIADAGYPVILVERTPSIGGPHGPVRQDLPHPRLRRVHPDAEDGRLRLQSRTSTS